MAKPDPYLDLGLKKGATTEEIKSAFRQKAKAAHPDAGGDAEKFQQVSSAYRLLMSPEKRAKFDATGKIDDDADNSAMAPINIITEMMEQITAEAGDTIEIDVVQHMRDCMDMRVAEIEKQIRAYKAKAKKLKRFAVRFQRKAGDNLLRTMVERKAAMLEATILSGESAIRDIKAAKVILKDYSFDADVPTAHMRVQLAPSFAFSTTTGGP